MSRFDIDNKQPIEKNKIASTEGIYIGQELNNQHMKTIDNETIGMYFSAKYMAGVNKTSTIKSRINQKG